MFIKIKFVRARRTTHVSWMVNLTLAQPLQFEFGLSLALLDLGSNSSNFIEFNLIILYFA